jgi:hypothetical protein
MIRVMYLLSGNAMAMVKTIMEIGRNHIEIFSSRG